MYARFDPGAKGCNCMIGSLVFDPGRDGIPGVLLQHGGRRFVDAPGGDDGGDRLSGRRGLMYIRKRVKMYFILFLLLEMGMLGVFLAQTFCFSSCFSKSPW